MPKCLVAFAKAALSRPPHGGRGLKWMYNTADPHSARSPSPRRAWIEMYIVAGKRAPNLASPSPRRAWIEIFDAPLCEPGGACRPPHGGRGLKSRHLRRLIRHGARRPPHGGRGLKWRDEDRGHGLDESPSPRRAWIEMVLSAPASARACWSPSPRRAWIEIERPLLVV